MQLKRPKKAQKGLKVIESPKTKVGGKGGKGGKGGIGNNSCIIFVIACIYDLFISCKKFLSI